MKKYVKPKIKKITIDNNISLILCSEPNDHHHHHHMNDYNNDNPYE